MADSAMQVDPPPAMPPPKAADLASVAPVVLEPDSAKRRKISSSPSRPAGSRSRSGTVLEDLQSVQDELQTAFPRSTSSRHSTTLGLSSSSAAASMNPLSSSDALDGSAGRKAAILSRVRQAREGLESFRRIWQAERGRFADTGPGGNNGAVTTMMAQATIANGSGSRPTITAKAAAAEDPDAALERRRATLLRVMMDWTTNRSKYLRVRYALDELLTHVDCQVLAPSSSSSRGDGEYPFVHPAILQSPTDRLIAYGQLLGLDVSIDNDDPDYGMGNFGANTDAGGGGDGGSGGRMDTLAFAARTVLLEVQIQQRTSTLSHKTAEATMTFNLIKLRASHYPNMEEEGIFLPEPTSLLTKDFQAYLDIVNRRDDSPSETSNNSKRDSSTTSRPLRAERAFERFARNLRQVVELDKLEGAAVGAEEVKPSSSPTVGAHRFDDLERIRSHISALADRKEILQLDPPEVLPHFRLSNKTIPAPTLSIRFRNVAAASATPFPSHHPDQDQPAAEETPLRPGWYVELSEGVIVGHDTFSASSSSSNALDAEATKSSYIRPANRLEAVLLDQPDQIPITSVNTFPAGGSSLTFQAGSSGHRAALQCKELPFGSLRQLDGIIDSLRRELALQGAFQRCFTKEGMQAAAAMAQDASSEDIIDDLDRFMRDDDNDAAGLVTRRSSILVTILADKLRIDIPAGYLATRPNATTFNVTYQNPNRWLISSLDDSSEASDSFDVDDFDLSLWLNAMM